MINSPTLSVLPSAPKAAKASSNPASNGTQQSFGSAFEMAHQEVAQKKAPVERQAIERKPSNQVSESAVGDRDTSVSKTDEPEQNKVASNSQERAAKSAVEDSDEKSADSHDADTSLNKSEASSVDKTSTDEKTSEGQKNGKELQADGQSLAVDQAVTASPAANANPDVKREESPVSDTSLEAEGEVAVAVNADSNGVLESSIADEQTTSPEAGGSLDAGTAPSVAELTSEDGEALPVSGENVKDNEAPEKEPRANLGMATDPLVAVSDEVAEETAEDTEIIAVSGVEEKSSASTVATETTTKAENVTVTLDAEQGQLKNSVNAGAEIAQRQDAQVVERLPQGAADTELDEFGDVETKASDNLRWVMEQMSKKLEPASVNNNVNHAALDKASLAVSDVLESLSDGELILDNDKIELPKDVSDMLGGKKALDQLMANLGGQLQAPPAQAQAQSALNALQNNLANSRPEGTAAQLTMQSPPNATAFPSEMAAKVSWVAKEGFKTAHIHLDPPELGSLTVKISVDHESNAHVSFVASSAQAKDALEGQMQRLREMLQQQGVELDSVDVEVSQGNGQAFGSSQSDDEAGQRGSGSGLGTGEDLLDGDGLENVGYVSPAEQGIDYYA